MKLKYWKGEIIDLAEHTEFAQKPRLSVLANSVDLANSMLARRVPDDWRVLEVGCGVQSYFRDCMRSKSNWRGTDVQETFGEKGRTIATELASVDNMPYRDGEFDLVLSNQSIEHWFEYGVDIASGLSEIRRVLGTGGRLVLNFPIHLHGDRIFVRGDFSTLNKVFGSAGYIIVRRTAYIDSRMSDYKGWRLCRFPDFYVRGARKSEATSYVVEYECLKGSCAHDGKVLGRLCKKAFPKRRIVSRYFHHGIVYVMWKVWKKASESVLAIKPLRRLLERTQ